MDVICKGVFGSHLYGLSTPTSDVDYKGIYMPTATQILLGTAPKTIDVSTNKGNTKNSSEDIDESYYSFQYFIENALKGETFAIDMLHMDNTIKYNIYWEYLVDNRKRFYSKDMKAFVGYAQRQAAKYSIKGSRLAFLEEVVSILSVLPKDDKLAEHIDKLPLGEFSSIKENSEGLYWLAVSKMFYFSTPIYHVVDSLSKIQKGYGKRAEQARDNKGVDWKAISHAFRAAYQLRDIFENGDFEYPLKETNFLKQVKAGELDFLTEVQGELEKVIDQVKELAELSDLPDKVDRTWADNLVFLAHKEIIKGDR